MIADLAFVYKWQPSELMELDLDEALYYHERSKHYYES